MEFKDVNLVEAEKAHQLVEDFKGYILKRAERWAEVNQARRESLKLPSLENFAPSRGYRVSIKSFATVFNESISEITFAFEDMYPNGATNFFSIPKSFIFAEETPLEKNYEEYVRLNAEFSK